MALGSEAAAAEAAQLEALLEAGLYRPPTALYHQPADLPAFREQEARHRAFAPRLQAHLQARYAARFREEAARRHEFMALAAAWGRRVAQIERENGEERYADHQDAPKHPSLLAAASAAGHNTGSPAGGAAAFMAYGGSRSRSRSAGLVAAGDVVRSEEELNQVLQALIEQDRDNPATRWMATLAVEPPMIQADVKHLQGARFVDENRLLLREPRLPGTDAVSSDGYGEAAVWTEDEEHVFVEKFLQHPKRFAQIAACLEKSTADCVQFYYRNKLRLRLKQRLQAYRRNPPPGGSDGLPSKKKVGRPPRTPAQPPIDEEDEAPE